MFNVNHIHELLKGQLSDQGYKHILGVVSFYIRKYNWPKTIIVSVEDNSSTFWVSDDVKELTHQFFEWILSKRKVDNLHKIPDGYLSYYFSQMLVSYVSDRIKQEQQKKGLSFEKCRELVLSISNDDLVIEPIDGIDYVYNHSFTKLILKPQNEIDNTLSYLSKIPLTEKNKQFKPLVKMAIEDVLNSIESPIPIRKLTEYVYQLFDQRSFDSHHLTQETSSIEFKTVINPAHSVAIKSIIKALSIDDIRLIYEYLFQSNGEVSLSELATKYNLPKSSLHFKIENFRKKIVKTYTPVDEEDGINFMQNISTALDKLSK